VASHHFANQLSLARVAHKHSFKSKYSGPSGSLKSLSNPEEVEEDQTYCRQARLAITDAGIVDRPLSDILNYNDWFRRPYTIPVPEAIHRNHTRGKGQPVKPLALNFPRYLARSRWRIRSCFRTGCGLGGRGLARGILRWRRLGCGLNSWWCGFLPWARRV